MQNGGTKEKEKRKEGTEVARGLSAGYPKKKRLSMELEVQKC